MDRDLLLGYLGKGLSLNQIGALTNRDPSTVGYWIQRYGFTANGREKFAPRGGLTREQLEPLVESGATLEQMAAQLDRSTSTIRHWLKRHGLQTRRHHRHRAKCVEARANGQTRFLGLCAKHGETEFLAMPAGRSRCARCNSEAVAARRRRVKATLVEEAGGACMICGYDRFQGALQFHHLDPLSKAFALSREGVTRSIEKARIEARKCVLLCSNCHAEVEAGIATLS